MSTNKGRDSRSYFHGTYQVTLDEKGRFSVPAEIRYKLLPEDRETFMIFPSGDSYLMAYPLQEWFFFIDKVRENISRDKLHQVIHLLESQVAECPLDAQGRIRIPTSLIADLELNKDLTISAAGNHFRIWNTTDYKAFQRQIDRSEYNALINHSVGESLHLPSTESLKHSSSLDEG
ncbi:MAG: division/cell wall cluster transcriptional repressor MraZ [bacterium]